LVVDRLSGVPGERSSGESLIFLDLVELGTAFSARYRVDGLTSGSRRCGEAGTRHTVPVTTVDPDQPEHLVVQEAVFAGAHFWVALNRLADGRGHEGHDRYLTGSSEHTDRYTLYCVTCARPVATMLVEREAPPR
jgi:hypothetical protein